MANKLYDKGLTQMRKAFGSEADQYVALLKKISPQFAQVNVEFPFGSLYAREKVLDLRIREIASLAALTVLGHSQPQLALHTKAALAVGVTQQEILEVVLQMTAYGGFPAATNALFTVNAVFASLKETSKPKAKRKSR
jgi:4-carboxymuconolactone decarboxylase